MCSAHAAVRGFVGELVGARDGGDVLLDMEAGLEHLSRGTGRHVDTAVAVLEPYYRALETGRRVVELAHELGIGRVVALANKVRTEEDREALREYCERHSLELLGEVPFDETLLAAERAGVPPVDYAPDAPAVRAVEAAAAALLRGDTTSPGQEVTA
ncbi:MAG: hypothetical protein KY453_06215 [Gemmatimonadetes bacterium]|nr:hypothetical protein [Gemmatimonadota bacterium]